MAQAHEFLRNFCLSNPHNQALLHKHLDLFLTPGVSKFVDRLFLRQEKQQCSNTNYLDIFWKWFLRFVLSIKLERFLIDP